MLQTQQKSQQCLSGEETIFKKSMISDRTQVLQNQVEPTRKDLWAT